MTVRPTSVDRHPATFPTGRNLLAVASGKGGVGKTWLAVTLSHALARAGRRVLLFDGDLGLANVDVQLGLLPGHDLSGVVAGRATVEETIERFTEGGFDVLVGSSGSGQLASVGREQVNFLRRQILMLSTRYDVVVMDLGAGVDGAVLSLAQSGGTILALVTDEPTSLTDAYAFIKVMARQRAGADIRVVVNLSASTREGEKTYAALRRACESFLGISPPLAGIVRRDPNVRDTIRHQRAMLTRHPNSPASADVEALCAGLELGQ